MTITIVTLGFSKTKPRSMYSLESSRVRYDRALSSLQLHPLYRAKECVVPRHLISQKSRSMLYNTRVFCTDPFVLLSVRVGCHTGVGTSCSALWEQRQLRCRRCSRRRRKSRSRRSGRSNYSTLRSLLYYFPCYIYSCPIQLPYKVSYKRGSTISHCGS